MKNNEVLTEVWARGTIGGVKKKGLNRGTVQRSGDLRASGMVESALSLKFQGGGRSHP